MREVPFVPEADDLALATSHLVQSSSASRVTAAPAGLPGSGWSEIAPQGTAMPRLAANAAVIGLTSTPIQPQRLLAFCFSFFSCITVALHIGPSKAPEWIAACLMQCSN